ncbi:Aste57867_18907 [Aphanomyces stellatus]|uniref:Aste57867_18907 protein n=1 Tax=Aphanomyces stellatus TaxID=120398 RepID=A0A485LBX4_9STRA|nr:hypothetical protein As57867_018843 [Aphanomyces stellatus]VFT95639.1 Aste57867_18907 [Aphanomyces stellatus]
MMEASDDLVVAIDEALRLKRSRQTQKMQRYRKRLLEKTDLLRAHAVCMEAEIDEFMRRREARGSGTILPWKEVAKALGDATCVGEKDNKYLQQQVQVNRATILALKHWVATSVPSSLRGHTWQNVTLSGHAASRLLGFDWISRHMHHNTDNIFQRCLFPPISSPELVDDFILDTSNMDGLQYIWRDQREVPYSLEIVRDLFARPHFYAMLGGSHLSSAGPSSNEDIAVVDADNTMLAKFNGALQYIHSQMSSTVHVHYLAREFTEPNRCVFVARSIHDDELLHNDTLQRSLMNWFVLDRIGPNRTKLRALTLSTQAFSKDGFISLEDEGLRWSVDVRAMTAADDASKERRVMQHIQQKCTQFGNTYNEDLEVALRPVTPVELHP